MARPLLCLTALLVACAGPSEPERCQPGRCADPDTVCVDSTEGARCECRPGTMLEQGHCVVPTECTDSTCHGRGACTVQAGAVHCQCEPMFAGELCEQCAGGLHDDGAGGCTADACTPNPCTGDRRCVVMGGVASCACPAGNHDMNGGCVPDTTCMPTTCGGRGSCNDDGGVVTCMCEAGFAGRFCDACDLEHGYHDDGAGACTMDVCLPDPCTAPHRGRCTDAGGVPSCACDVGFHLDLDACVMDETCTSATCGGHGACSVAGGIASCACDSGWAEPRCDMCAAGFHDDGAGNCTTSACAPNPCTTPNRSVCTMGAAGASCACDAGYHDDGVGGCTSDPCMPDPCAASGQACRNTGGAAECYTPVCNDNNSCTADSLVAGRCVNMPLPDGASCSTTICLRTQTCTGGTCGGGTAVSCDDTNPCTTDSCDPVAGCAHANDDSVVPSDGVSCTTDACHAGVASHAGSDAACDDGRWCTGVERCLPSDPTAGASGCVAQSVPVAPGPDGTCGRYACNDTAMRFDFTPLSAGGACSDSIACTTGDQCDGTGACRGLPTSACGAIGACTGASWSGGVEVSPARVRGRILYNGTTSFPNAVDSSSVSLYLRSRSTGTLSRMEAVSFASSADASGTFPVRSFSATDDRIIDLPVVPGVYDVVYRRWSSMGTVGVITSLYPTDNYAQAEHVLLADLVIGPGVDTIDVDVAPVRVTGAIRYGGGTVFPNAVDSSSVSLYLRSRSTGTLSRMEAVSFASSADASGTFPVRSFSATDDRAIDLPVLPGAYDLVYRRWSSMGTAGVITSLYPTDNYAQAEHVLRENITIGPGATSLDAEVAPVRVTGAIRYGGGTTFPNAVDSSSVSLYLRSRSTGTLSRMEAVSFASSADASGTFPVRSFSATDDRVIDLPVLPGAYDLVYRRWSSMGTAGVITSLYPTDNYAQAEHVLVTNVMIGPGATALDAEVAPVRVTGAIRYGGGTTFPNAVDSSSVSLYLRSRSTGTLSRMEAVSFASSADGSGTFPARSFSATDDRAIDLPVLPGAYDLVYRRWSSMGTAGVITSLYPTDNYAQAEHVLAENIAIGPGATALDAEVAPVRVTGAIHYGAGAVFPNAVDSSSVSLYLRSRSTGTLSRLEAVSFASSADATGTFPVRSFSATDDRMIDLPVLAGAYDLVYRRWSSMGTAGVITSLYPTDNYAQAEHLLRENIVIGPGATSLDAEVAPVRVAGAIRYGGGATFPNAVDSSSVSLYLRSRSTGTLSRFEAVSFASSADATGTFPVRSFSATDDRIIDLPVVPGSYDVIYRRWSSMGTAGVITSLYPTDNYAQAEQAVQECVVIE